ncbi:MAG: peptidylprolyl isomerase [Candidatus Muproteobacteria bacterium RBG_16_65_34]|uniref:Peptidyl-prolyl cis-trans isomerase n=1 Tax=Candidatus Muproteobacteria bacterium RBG_16_65_34 TaxID=1817760 RepID=A0A1F6TRJ7_9PROT|nr:MAG: peptidylprolyl isomerase [Candidatus Muproteobacteria bacterium RBG_16_65_34]
MNRVAQLFLAVSLAALCAGTLAGAPPAKTDNPRARLTTSLGVIEIELDARRAPETVRNFLGHVQSGFYRGTLFHRTIPGFMIQGGGFLPGMKAKPEGAPIRNEADNGLRNLTGTVAMARTPDPHSAAAQFFINTVNNPFLDHRDKSLHGWGYAVFGKVTKGMEVVQKIAAIPAHEVGPHQNVPIADVVITKAELIK